MTCVLASAAKLADTRGMRASLSLILSWAACTLSNLSAQTESEALVSGPPPGSPLGPITCYAERGPFAGQEFDAASKVGDSPAAFLFIHDLSRNTAPVIREFDRLGREHEILGYQWFPIMLQSDRTEGENMLKRVNGSLKLHHPLVLSLDGLEGPGDYALNRRCTLSLVLAKGNKVTESIALTDTGPADFPKLKTWVQSVAGSIPEDREALRALLAARLPSESEALRRFAVDQMLEVRRLRERLSQSTMYGGRGNPNNNMMRQRQNRNRRTEANNSSERSTEPKDPPGETRKREGKPPEDATLNSALRAFIRKTNDDARCDEVFQQITTRAAESESLTAEAVEMFKLMLSFRDRYGTDHAQSLAEKFLKEHAKASKE